MNKKSLMLTLLTCIVATGSVMAQDHNHQQTAYQADTPQLVKKFRADSSRLPVNQLINKYLKQSDRKERLLPAPALQLPGATPSSGEQAAR